MKRVEAVAMCRELLDAPVVAGHSISGTRRGTMITVVLDEKRWFVATPIELGGRGFHYVRPIPVNDRNIDTYTFERLSNPPELLEQVLTLANAKLEGLVTEAHDRLKVARLDAKDGTLSAELPYHYFFLDRDLLVTAIELIVDVRTALIALLGDVDPQLVAGATYRDPAIAPSVDGEAWAREEEKFERKHTRGRTVSRVLIGIGIAFVAAISIASWLTGP